MYDHIHAFYVSTALSIESFDVLYISGTRSHKGIALVCKRQILREKHTLVILYGS